MFKGRKKIAIVIAILLAGLLVIAGCGNKAANQAPADNSGSEISGSITAAGSSALLPLVEEAAAQFMSKNPNARINVQAGGSGTGLKLVSEGSVDIGNSDIFANEKLDADKAKELVDHKVCVVGFATVVNPNVKVDNVTKQQLIDIFTGKITNWKELGGDDQKIVIINRPTSSGTRATFKKYALNGQEEAQGIALTEENSGAIKKVVADTPGSISYLALSYVDSSVKALKLEGEEPTKENITSGKYPIWSYEHMYTKGEPTGLTKAFLDYMVSDEVKPLVEQLGYIAISDMKVSRDN
ncbi:phosphate ABC transporter substrate-binding protein PstS family protein [Biomaibacter acetigenes]|jgi:phosphate transport system substrate-binding protein|uniref:Phosphate-binding protein n=1 Tax=Biomaibacter acetigenes TaxID=2316383 RepID=A0A3G2R7V4_9FIRM|nr:phosphate ABC transporter substrate-binding protein [Biomaibacter acetigenes]AYO31516.1 phosphate ABC transporter substrate-binding protein PstS family protein [Biomaibacter acetigenes]MDN5312935.1 phosphate transport system substrate-binding protein [Thermoanaerobacteraceae bacterium]RKL62170.1 phosphate ABC transporter substrate-binding protein [Thermoanaerobacteraceae bacterium SP2]